MNESLTIHIPWSAAVEATAARRFKESADSPSWAPWVAWCKLCFGVAFLLCGATGIYVAPPPQGLPVQYYLNAIMILLVGVYMAVYQTLLLYAHGVIARAREARGREALEAGKVEWRLSSLGLECRAGSRPLLSLAWESVLRVTQFPDGFVLTVCFESAYNAAKGYGEEVPGAPVFPGPPTRESVRIRQILGGAPAPFNDQYLPNDQHWLPVDAFPDSGVVWFVEMARQLAADYRAVRLRGSATGSGVNRPSEAALALASAVESMIAAGKDTEEIAAFVDVFLRQQGGPQEMSCGPKQSLHQTDRP
jgi:hypothetical protein